jgi:hypothetical protein
MRNQVKELARHIAREEFFDSAKHKPLRLSCSSDTEKMFRLQVWGLRLHIVSSDFILKKNF